MMPQDSSVGRLVDGGDRACGELLMILIEAMLSMPTGALIRLVATDPAAPIDIPAWCYLTGHHYRGCGRQPDGRPHYDLEVSGSAVATRNGKPWHISKISDGQREGTPSP